MKLFCCLPMDNDATSFYRAVQPIAQLTKLMPNLEIYQSTSDIRIRDLAHMDICFIQRPYELYQVAVFELAKSLGVKVWIDYDDHLFDVPPENPAFDLYRDPRTREIMARMLREADLVTVSTEALATSFDDVVKRLKGYHVIPNAFNDYLFKDRPVFHKQSLVLWRGSSSHQKDILDFCVPIIQQAKKGADMGWLFSFWGYNPWFLRDDMKFKYIEPMDILKYHSKLKQINPNIMIVPLSNNRFNKCKSNIAWIEATYSGAVAIAPNWEEWRKPGVVTFETPDGFGRQLEILMNTSEKELSSFNKLSWEYIQDNLRLSQVNKKRAELLHSLHENP